MHSPPPRARINRSVLTRDPSETHRPARGQRGAAARAGRVTPIIPKGAERGDTERTRTVPARKVRVARAMDRKIPDFSGTWKMKSSENFEELLKALGVNVMLRKIAVAAASKPSVEITQDGETLSIKTSTSVRTTHVTFTVGQEFNEATVDGRPCTSLPRWETDRKISCEQTLQKGEGPKTSWTREMTNDGELILTMTADDVVCTRVYIRE
ncbi:cellular retinoic acid-binding protein 2a [Astyanax mexicanus]|uniref:Cellular retinoic acid-binding protein 2-like n=2 Tax=Astyanax mexicanus TaxID=7994 RepID=A0A8T2LVP2_ASTMX|nr:cellular retinoic acid-binding protein 2a [Astyanax mexicanus]KAG9275779.1 cellular retinoic acid-binding protein 2-like [Astyanax mexicanus]